MGVMGKKGFGRIWAFPISFPHPWLFLGWKLEGFWLLPSFFPSLAISGVEIWGIWAFPIIFPIPGCFRGGNWGDLGFSHHYFPSWDAEPGVGS